MGSSKSLAELAQVVDGDVIGDPETVVLDVTHDSRQAAEGALFVAIVGEAHDGHDFIDQAVAGGAAAICVERRYEGPISQLVVGDTRGALGKLAAAVHANPSRDLAVIGVTGTNGKTTVTHFLDSLLTTSGFKTGVIGTIGSRVGDTRLDSVRTTPEASDFQRLLALMRDDQVSHVAVEVSSHALDLRRVDGTRFAAVGFTNLSQDHLDFHGSMEAYRRAKERLFTDFEVGIAVVNIDDPVGASIASSYRGTTITVGRGADFSFGSIEHRQGGTAFDLMAPDGRFEVVAPVLGAFNVSNLVVAIALATAVGAGVGDLVEALPEVQSVPGRFEVVSGDAEPLVVVDYAHTPEGIISAVATGRELVEGRVIVVFGAGGDRDRAKRPKMGEAASLADVVIATSDNPRSEDPDSIIDEVLAGAPEGAIRESNREAAIGAAVGMATEADVVLILGKGHETGQEAGAVITPFDDRDVARNALNSWRKSANIESDSGSIGP